MRKLQKGDILIAKNVCKMETSQEEALIIGKEYEVLSVYSDNMIRIKSEVDELHYFEEVADVGNGADYYFNLKNAG